MHIQKLKLACFLLLTSTAWATQYYVDAVNGSDSNNCLAAGSGHACLTIAHAESLMAAGDTLNIAAGTYRLSTAYNSTSGRISPKNSQMFTGPSCTPTVTQCTAIISGGKEIGSLATGPDGNGNWSVTGMTQSGYTPNYSCDTGYDCNRPEDLFFDGVPQQHVPSTTLPTLTTGQWWFDYTNHIIYFHQNPSGHVVETSVLSTFFSPNGANNVTVQNLTITEFASELNQGGGIDPQYGQTAAATFATGWLVQNNYVTLNHSSGVRAGFNMQVLNNVLTVNGQFGVGGGLPAGTAGTNSGLVVQGNTVTYNNFAHVSPGFGAGGMKFGNTQGVVVRGNIVNNNIGNGIHADVNSINFLIDGNTVENNVDPQATGGSGYGIIYEISNGSTTVRNNHVLFTGLSGAVGLYSSTSQGVEAYCNVVESGPSIGPSPWTIGATNRGNVTQPPNPSYCSAWPATCYQQSRSNYFHHNTVIWDAGAVGTVGFLQNDTANQPNFFSNNTAPDYDWYHASTAIGSWSKFKYDNNNTGSNTNKIFGPAGTSGTYQNAGADVNGTYDNVYNSGFPAVAITSPADQSTLTGSTTVTSTASDTSGISKVEFYLDWTLKSTVTSGPYTYLLSGASAGTHVISALAYANSTVKACNAITVNVSVSAPGHLIVNQVTMRGGVTVH